MKRKIIHIDQDKCTGCGQCVLACQQSAIGFENGKAKLMREDYCDGLGVCLPMCLAGAITFVEKDIEGPDEATIDASSKVAAAHVPAGAPAGGGCPGSAVRAGSVQWPLQMKLVPPVADFYNGADLVVAADCCAYTYPKFAEEFLGGKLRIIGCPKLDEVDYTDLLAAIFTNNDLNSITVTRIEVPCCDGIERAVRAAVKANGKDIPVRSVVFSIEGTILSDN
ncbi:MAG: 4Fe-4S binding protein [Coriobacteriia bacterium]|nr:4Fe-4S binding protein [Coriobacteriia bacterium]MCL2537700.1 4Fe-4S binding protein [Coriobacteriia bacterium]